MFLKYVVESQMSGPIEDLYQSVGKRMRVLPIEHKDGTKCIIVICADMVFLRPQRVEGGFLVPSRNER